MNSRLLDQTVWRIFLAVSISVPLFALLCAIMMQLPAWCCWTGLYVGLAAFLIGSDYAMQLKSMTLIGGLLMFASLIVAAVRGWLG